MKRVFSQVRKAIALGLAACLALETPAMAQVPADQKAAETVLTDGENKGETVRKATSSSLPKENRAKSTSAPKATGGNLSKGAFHYRETVNGYGVDLSAPAGTFPAGTSVKIKYIGEQDQEEIKEQVLQELSLPDTEELWKLVSFDISFFHDNQEIQPKDHAVSVKLTLDDSTVNSLKGLTKQEGREATPGSLVPGAGREASADEDSDESGTILRVHRSGDNDDDFVMEIGEEETALINDLPESARAGSRIFVQKQVNSRIASDLQAINAEKEEEKEEKEELDEKSSDEELVVPAAVNENRVSAYLFHIDDSSRIEQVDCSTEADSMVRYDAEAFSIYTLALTRASLGGTGDTVNLTFNGSWVLSGKTEETTAKAVLDRINQYRYEACKNGYRDPATGNALTLSDYVPMKWASEMDEIAAVRAVEASLRHAHTRPNGESCFTVKCSKGYGSSAECLAWNRNGILYGIDQWGNEKSAYLGGDYYSDNTGHYRALISTNYTHVAVRAYHRDGDYWYSIAGEFSGRSGLTTTVKNQPTIRTVAVPKEDVSVGAKGADSVYAGESITLTPVYEVQGASTENSRVTAANSGLTASWSAIDPELISVTPKNGGTAAVVKGLKPGKARVWVAESDIGTYCIFEVTVEKKPVPVTGVKLNRTTLTLKEGTTGTLTASVLPSDADNKNVVWSSSSIWTASVDANGKITAREPGKATITVRTVDGSYTAKCEVTVTYQHPVTGIKLNKTSLKMVRGSYEYLSAVVSPADADYPYYDWSSSNSAVASVSSYGTVSGLKKGTAVITVTTRDGGFKASCKVTVTEKPYEWRYENGKYYWYEYGVKQGLQGRGKEIYDPDSGYWYWLDSVQNGARAVSKDVYQPYTYQGKDNNGKWVRYDSYGHMIKGWDIKDGKKYYFDLNTGAMTKGLRKIDGANYYFNPNTGVAIAGSVTIDGIPYQFDKYGRGVNCQWVQEGDGEYWYENGQRQGYDPKNPSFRGKEIYDPGSKAWYWLDNNAKGKKAVSKDVYQPYTYQGKDNIGKWVRYDADGHMIKHWQLVGENIYYFDPKTGAMVKGDRDIGGYTFTFDTITGIMKLRTGHYATAGKQEILDRINEIRYEACVEGVRNPVTGQPLTLADYVPAVWDNEMDCISRIRAIEASYTLDHIRLDGSDCFETMSVDESTKYRYEDLSWGYRGCMEGIELWYGEKSTWVRGGSGVTGHYTSIIDPTSTRVGIACYYRSGARWPYTVAGSLID